MICIMCNVLMRDNYDLNNGLLYFYFEIMIFMFLVGLFFFCKFFFIVLYLRLIRLVFLIYSNN